ncbi:ABC transporter permease subunit, partial [Mesorhizobium sp. M7D.F.Ca.US.004.03.1.1]|uniref:ABC transporter permease n=1 Tax=Mesorhizobium sp. M7D.F.Ca.US.004.03.1.1 TaxID=2496702 RepID=UPI00247B0B0A
MRTSSAKRIGGRRPQLLLHRDHLGRSGYRSGHRGGHRPVPTGAAVRSTLMALFMTPMMVPVIVAAADMFFLFSDFSPQGTFMGVIIAHTVLGTPFVVVTVTASLSQFDGNLMRAACSLGSPPWHAFRTVMLPIILPGVISGTPFASLLRRRGRRAFHWK